MSELEVCAESQVDVYVGKKLITTTRPITRAEMEQIRRQGAKLRTVAVALLLLLTPAVLLLIEEMLARRPIAAGAIAIGLGAVLIYPIHMLRISFLAQNTREDDDVIPLSFGDSLITGDPKTADVVSSTGVQFKRDGAFLCRFRLLPVTRVARMPGADRMRIEEALAQGQPPEPRELSVAEREEATRVPSHVPGYLAPSMFVGVIGTVTVETPLMAASIIGAFVALFALYYASFIAYYARRGRQRLRLETDITYLHKTYRWAEFLGSSSQPWTVEGKPADWRIDPWAGHEGG